jgi:hypothetical protein
MLENDPIIAACEEFLTKKMNWGRVPSGIPDDVQPYMVRLILKEAGPAFSKALIESLKDGVMPTGELLAEFLKAWACSAAFLTGLPAGLSQMKEIDGFDLFSRCSTLYSGELAQCVHSHIGVSGLKSKKMEW